MRLTTLLGLAAGGGLVYWLLRRREVVAPPPPPEVAASIMEGAPAMSLEPTPSTPLVEALPPGPVQSPPSIVVPMRTPQTEQEKLAWMAASAEQSRAVSTAGNILAKAGADAAAKRAADAAKLQADAAMAVALHKRTALRAAVARLPLTPVKRTWAWLAKIIDDTARLLKFSPPGAFRADCTVQDATWDAVVELLALRRDVGTAATAAIVDVAGVTGTKIAPSALADRFSGIAGRITREQILPVCDRGAVSSLNVLIGGNLFGLSGPPPFGPPPMPLFQAGRLGPEFGLRPRPGGFPGASVMGMGYGAWWHA